MLPQRLTIRRYLLRPPRPPPPPQMLDRYLQRFTKLVLVLVLGPSLLHLANHQQRFSILLVALINKNLDYCFP